MSQKKKAFLSDSEPKTHTIVFDQGQMVDILCPKQKSGRPKTPSSGKKA